MKTIPPALAVFLAFIATAPLYLPDFYVTLLNYIGLAVPVGRMTSEQMLRVADVAERYGNGELRLTVGQNLIVANVSDNRIGALTEEQADEIASTVRDGLPEADVEIQPTLDLPSPSFVLIRSWL